MLGLKLIHVSKTGHRCFCTMDKTVKSDPLYREYREWFADIGVVSSYSTSVGSTFHQCTSDIKEPKAIKPKWSPPPFAPRHFQLSLKNVFFQLSLKVWHTWSAIVFIYYWLICTGCTQMSYDNWKIHVQYIPRNMHTVFALLCFVVVMHWLIFPYPSGLLHWHCGNLTIAPVPAKQPW